MYHKNYIIQIELTNEYSVTVIIHRTLMVQRHPVCTSNLNKSFLVNFSFSRMFFFLSQNMIIINSVNWYSCKKCIPTQVYNKEKWREKANMVLSCKRKIILTNSFVVVTISINRPVYKMNTMSLDRNPINLAKKKKKKLVFFLSSTRWHKVC